jgi:hypothetical protein
MLINCGDFVICLKGNAEKNIQKDKLYIKYDIRYKNQRLGHFNMPELTEEQKYYREKSLMFLESCDNPKETHILKYQEYLNMFCENNSFSNDPSYSGDKIVQFIKDGILKEGDLISQLSGTIYNLGENSNEVLKSEFGEYLPTLFFNIIGLKSVGYWYNFWKARTSGKRIKHRTWNNFVTLNEAMQIFSSILPDAINELFASDEWMIESEEYLSDNLIILN